MNDRIYLRKCFQCGPPEVVDCGLIGDIGEHHFVIGCVERFELQRKYHFFPENNHPFSTTQLRQVATILDKLNNGELDLPKR